MALERGQTVHYDGVDCVFHDTYENATTGTMAMMDHPVRGHIAVPISAIKNTETTEVDIRHVIDSDVAQVVPGWLLPSVTALLEDEADTDFPDSTVNDVAQAIHRNAQSQFPASLIDVLTQLAGLYGPAGVALAAVSLTQWPALYERTIGGEISQATHDRLQQIWVNGSDTALRQRQELANNLSLAVDTSWNNLIAAVQEFRGMVLRTQVETAKAHRDHLAIVLGYTVDEDFDIEMSWDKLIADLQNRESSNRSATVMHHQVARTINVPEDGSWDAMMVDLAHHMSALRQARNWQENTRHRLCAALEIHDPSTLDQIVNEIVRLKA